MANRKEIEWPAMLAEFGWTTKATGGYWPELCRPVRSVTHRILHGDCCWCLYVDTVAIASGDLTEMLKLSNSIEAGLPADLFR